MLKISHNMNQTAPTREIQSARKVASTDKSAQSAQPKALARSIKTDISTTAQLMSRAAGQLDGNQNLREDAVEAAREKLRNWNGLNEHQLDDIAEDLVADFA